MDRKTLAAVAVAFAIGYWMSHQSAPEPKPDRPVLRWVVRAAKNLLWLAVLADPPPVVKHDQHLVHAPPVGDDGYPLIDHGKGL